MHQLPRFEACARARLDARLRIVTKILRCLKRCGRPDSCADLRFDDAENPRQRTQLVASAIRRTCAEVHFPIKVAQRFSTGKNHYDPASFAAIASRRKFAQEPCAPQAALTAASLALGDIGPGLRSDASDGGGPGARCDMG